MLRFKRRWPRKTQSFSLNPHNVVCLSADAKRITSRVVRLADILYRLKLRRNSADIRLHLLLLKSMIVAFAR